MNILKKCLTLQTSWAAEDHQCVLWGCPAHKMSYFGQWAVEAVENIKYLDHKDFIGVQPVEVLLASNETSLLEKLKWWRPPHRNIAELYHSAINQINLPFLPLVWRRNSVQHTKKLGHLIIHNLTKFHSFRIFAARQLWNCNAKPYILQGCYFTLTYPPPRFWGSSMCRGSCVYKLIR